MIQNQFLKIKWKPSKKPVKVVKKVNLALLTDGLKAEREQKITMTLLIVISLQRKIYYC